ncbi:hypothetical protein C4572_02600 [Candidatus Parcubacteria bacterium]|nr:MAG: hypothetical protein C4572_02600 [Candidatus Parcubacteria bacterium]
MREFQEKKKFKRILYSKWVFIGLAVVLGLLLFSTFKVYRTSKRSLAKNEDIKRQLAEMEIRKNEMEERISVLESDSGREEEIRRRFNVAKPGEKMLVILDKTGQDVKISEEEKAGFFSRAWSGFKNLFR